MNSLVHVPECGRDPLHLGVEKLGHWVCASSTLEDAVKFSSKGLFQRALLSHQQCMTGTLSTSGSFWEKCVSWTLPNICLRVCMGVLPFIPVTNLVQLTFVWETESNLLTFRRVRILLLQLEMLSHSLLRPLPFFLPFLLSSLSDALFLPIR